ncbi:hypothetical protein ABZT51_48175, partial [Streptomyces sp. NPDC005373]|uniref:hypothetical protein n=1 Tax=Streptomyces sp. NPDC005373 TaxID=3156879 RepID=UPI0033AF2B24
LIVGSVALPLMIAGPDAVIALVPWSETVVQVLGYAMGEHHDAALVGTSLKMAAAARGGQVDGTIFHIVLTP